MADRTVYIIEDDDAVRAATRALLECEGFAVKDFVSAEDFTSRAPPHLHGCAILDVNMPGMSGLELLDQIRRDGIGLPVIVVTGRANARVVQAVYRAGAALLEKPYKADDLLARIDRALEEGSRP
jgi:two-component system response regulator FixJ